jgi:hypothetical protein
MQEFDDNFEDTNMPTERDMASAYGGKYLSVKDVGNERRRGRITRVGMADLKGDDGVAKRKGVIWVAGFDKPMILNATNFNELVAAFGSIPARWVGATVGVYVDSNVMFAGKRVPGLRLKAVLPSAPVAPKPPPSVPPFPEESGDPGFDPDGYDNAA